MTLRILDLAGAPAAMGEAHGSAFRDDICRYTAGRVALAGSEVWTGQARTPGEIHALANACIVEHRGYAPELMEELDGIARATGLSVADLVITNGFTDFIDVVYASGATRGSTIETEDDCTAFIVPDGMSDNAHGFFGQTWDMHEGSLPYVVMLRGRPTGRPAFLAFSVTGCIGMIGMNEAGIAVGINNLLGGDGQVGVTWPFIVRRILQQDNLEEAIACITAARRAGAHNYMLFDRHGAGVNVEAMATHCEITRIGERALVHSNHCLSPSCLALDRPRAPESQASSEARLARARAALAGGMLTAEKLMALTRDEVVCVHPTPPLHMTTCGAAIMQPALGRMWAVGGLPDQNAFEALSF
jgi:isopenicillin-N N-acyltransferase-like protein